jgi:general secretion pathway protein A
MYAPYFGLSHEPFSIAPDPRYLFMSERHREALAHLLYGLGGGGGFVLLTGEIGTGKTTVCRGFLEQIPDNCNVAYIFNPKLTAIELLQSVCEEFRIEVPRRVEGAVPTVKDYLDPLNAFLLRSHAEGRNSVLIIDEAQNLSADVLEQLRLLTNLETSERKLLQIVLIGQPELRELLAQPSLEQLAQRVIARYHLDALTRTETQQYVRHRLEVAGLARAMPFDRRALERIHKKSGGVPRRINLLCDRALLGAFGQSEAVVTRPIVDQAAREVFGDPVAAAPSAWPRQAAVLGVGLLVGAGLMAGARWWAEAPPPAAEPVATTAPVAAEPPAPAAVDSEAVKPVVAEPAAPAASSAAPPTLLRDERQAWRELAGIWKLDPGEGDPCAALARESVHCFSKALPLVLIRQLDRPGIVALDQNTGRPSYALLTALNDKSATLVAGGSEQTVTLAALAARWNGEWSTLWRAPAGFDPRSPERDGGKLGGWLDEQLAKAGAAPADREAGNSLRARIRSFQLAQGLPADGVLGPLTFMQLNRSAALDEPHLRQAP